MLSRFWPALLFGALAACGSDGPSLSVDLRTDFIPGTEFDGVAVSAGDGASASFVVLQDQDFVRGVRVGRFDSSAGTRTVTLELMRAGAVLVERVATVTTPSCSSWSLGTAATFNAEQRLVAEVRHESTSAVLRRRRSFAPTPNAQKPLIARHPWIAPRALAPAACRGHGDKIEGEICERGECGLGLRC